MTTTPTHRCTSADGATVPFTKIMPADEVYPWATGYCANCDTEVMLPAEKSAS